MSNRLKDESSPYLLQHSQNPVDWFSWGEEAFENARAQDKPLFLSIGYSSCHWCHVMAHECFEDEDVAALMNKSFISIKVDREEMPHIDHIYMQACQILTGSGGWPLTIIMTPDKEPFFAATYLPKHTRQGLMGMMELIPIIDKLWHEKRADVIREASQISRYIRHEAAIRPGDGLDTQLIDKTYSELKSRFSPAYGGFGPAPKFPMPHHIMFLLRYFRRTHDHEALDMAATTLTSMQEGGIYDHVGFGFHRYATDEQWLVPHFEKMLYDQALLAFAYTEAHQVTGRMDFRKTAEDILTYVLRDMHTPDGLFASAQDADSKGGEGRYYLWTTSEVKSALGDIDYMMAKDAFGLRDEGNFAAEMEGGLNIIHLDHDEAGLAGRLGLTKEDCAKRVNLLLDKLYKVRLTRTAPFKDSKALIDWNGLMIAALAKAGAAFARPEYVNAAKAAADFILNTMLVNGRLKHVYMAGTARFEGGLDDYVFLIWGLIELYEATFEPGYLKAAIELNTMLIKYFRNISTGGFMSTAETDEVPLARTKTANDNAIPSGNSVAMINLLRLSALTGEPSLRDLAVETGKAFSDLVSRIPSAYTFMMCALDLMAGPSNEVIIAGEPDQRDTIDMIDAVRTRFLPNTVIMLKTGEGNDMPIMQGKHPIEGKATAYVCTGSSCLDPTTDVAEMIHYLS
jgi:uncharacterized protein